MSIDAISEDITIRPATLDDIAIIIALIERRNKELGIEPDNSEEEWRNDFTAPGFNLQTDTRLAFTRGGELVGYVSVDHQRHTHIWMGLEVRSDYREGELEDALYHWAEERAREHIALAPEGLRVTLSSWTDMRYTARQRLLDRHGFTLVRRFYRMEIKLAEQPPQPQWPTGIRVQNFQSGMERAVFDADNEAFRDHWGFMEMDYDEWAHHAFNPHTFDSSLWLLAMDRDQIAGFALCAREEAQEGGYEGWVHTLGVRRAWRRRGIAEALLYEAFNTFYQREIPNVLLGVDASSLTGATRLYERVGMSAIREFLRFQKVLRPGREAGTETLAE